MKTVINKVKNHRFGLLALIAVILVAISFVTRIFLLVSTPGVGELSILTILEAFLIGLFFDLVTATYFIIPMLFYLWICPEWLYQKRWHKYILNFIFFFFTSLLVFDSFSEWFFWEEFTTRFNFIAVDYLVYTTEVIGNIQQSYPIGWYILVALALTGIIVYKFRSWITH